MNDGVKNQTPTSSFQSLGFTAIKSFIIFLHSGRSPGHHLNFIGSQCCPNSPSISIENWGEIDHLHTAPPGIGLGTFERRVLSDHNNGDFIEQNGTRTHVTGRKR